MLSRFYTFRDFINAALAINPSQTPVSEHPKCQGTFLWSLTWQAVRLTRIKLRRDKTTCYVGKGQDSSASWREFIAWTFLVTLQW